MPIALAMLADWGSASFLFSVVLAALMASSTSSTLPSSSAAFRRQRAVILKGHEDRARVALLLFPVLTFFAAAHPSALGVGGVLGGFDRVLGCLDGLRLREAERVPLGPQAFELRPIVLVLAASVWAAMRDASCMAVVP